MACRNISGRGLRRRDIIRRSYNDNKEIKGYRIERRCGRGVMPSAFEVLAERRAAELSAFFSVGFKKEMAICYWHLIILYNIYRRHALVMKAGTKAHWHF